MKQITEQIYDIDTLVILKPEELCFCYEDSGYLTLSFGGKTYNKVSLTRLIPHMEKTEYISVTYQDEEKEWKEIGVIKDVAEFTGSQLEIVTEFLEFRYLIPVITKVYKIIDNRMGYLFIDVDTTLGKKKLAVNDWWHNFRFIRDKNISVTDADGNKYQIPDTDKLDKASIKKIQLFI